MPAQKRKKAATESDDGIASSAVAPTKPRVVGARTSQLKNTAATGSHSRPSHASDVMDLDSEHDSISVPAVDSHQATPSKTKKNRVSNAMGKVQSKIINFLKPPTGVIDISSDDETAAPSRIGKGKGKGNVKAKAKAKMTIVISSGEEDENIMNDGMILDSGYMEGSFAKQQAQYGVAWHANVFEQPAAGNSGGDDRNGEGPSVQRPQLMARRTAEARKHEDNAKRRERRKDAPTTETKIKQQELDNAIRSRMCAEFIIRVLQVKQRVMESTKDRGSVKEVISEYQDCHSRQRLDDDSKLWEHVLTSDGTELLEAFSRNPVQIDINDLSSKGILSRGDDQLDSSLLNFYLRALRCRTRQKLIELVSTVMHSHPSEAAWAIQHLAGVHVPYAEIQKITSSAFRSINMEMTADIIFEIVTEEFLRPFRLPIVNSIEYTIPYFGLTLANTPEGRLEEDQSVADTHSRETNVLEIANRLGIRCDTFHVTPFDFQVSSSDEIRYNPVAGRIEVVGIACLRGFGTNSAPGGVRSEYIPVERLLAIIRACLDSSNFPGYLNVEMKPNAILGHLLLRLYKDEWDFWRRVFPGAKHMTEEGFRSTAIAAGAGHAPLTVQLSGESQVYNLTSLKDVSLEDQQGNIGPIPSQTTGRSTQLDRHIRSFINPKVPPHGDMDFKTFNQIFGPYVDFFRFYPGHAYGRLALLYFRRLLDTYRPLLLKTWSNIVFTAMRSGGLVDIYDKITDEEVRAEFVAGRSPPSLSDFFPIDPYQTNSMPTCSSDDYNNHTGMPAIMRYGPGKRDFCILLPFRDYGGDKHDPVFSLELCNVQYLAHGAAEVYQCVILHNLTLPSSGSKSTENFLIDCMNQGLKILRKNGWFEVMAKCKEDLRASQKAVGTLRSKAPERKPPKKFQMPERPPQVVAAPLNNNARLHQYEKLKANDDERIKHGWLSTSIPWRPSFMNDEDVFAWFMALKTGTNVVASAASQGRTLEGQKRARESQIAIGKYSRENAQWKIDIKETSGLTKNEEDEIQRNFTNIATCLSKISNPSYYRNQDLALDASWRYALCETCNRIAFGGHSGSRHHCGKQKNNLTCKAFPTLTRLLYAHNLLCNPYFTQYIEDFTGNNNAFTILDTNILLKPLPAREILLRNIEQLPAAPYNMIDENLMIWAREDDLENEDWLLTLAFDVAIPFISKAPQEFWPDRAADKNLAFNKSTLDKIVKVLTGESQAPLRLVRCSYGHCGVHQLYGNASGYQFENYYPHSCSFTEMAVKDDSSKKRVRACNATETSDVTEYLGLPAVFLRSLWLRQRVYNDQPAIHMWARNNV